MSPNTAVQASSSWEVGGLLVHRLAAALPDCAWVDRMSGVAGTRPSSVRLGEVWPSGDVAWIETTSADHRKGTPHTDLENVAATATLLHVDLSLPDGVARPPSLVARLGPLAEEAASEVRGWPVSSLRVDGREVRAFRWEWAGVVTTVAELERGACYVSVTAAPTVAEPYELVGARIGPDLGVTDGWLSVARQSELAEAALRRARRHGPVRERSAAAMHPDHLRLADRPS